MMSDLRHLAKLQAKYRMEPYMSSAQCSAATKLLQLVCDTDFAALAERLERAESENREIVSVVRSLVMRPYMSRHQAIVDAEGKAMAILKRYEETEADHE